MQVKDLVRYESTDVDGEIIADYDGGYVRWGSPRAWARNGNVVPREFPATEALTRASSTVLANRRAFRLPNSWLAKFMALACRTVHRPF